MNYKSSSHKKFAMVAITTALVATAAVPASAASFSDVSDRYEEAVKFLVDNQITEGLTTSSFGTSKSIKRVDSAIMLAKALELDLENVKGSGFTDVPARAKTYVDALKTAKIVDGKSTSTFAVDQEITRGEAALMLMKAYDLKAENIKVTFSDVGARYEAAVAALIEHKISTGKTPTTFGTQQPITRGEFAVFIHRLENLQKEVAPISVVVKNEEELMAAFENKEINKITLSENIIAKELPVIVRNIEVDLNGKTLIGNLKYSMPNEQKEVSLKSSQVNGKLQGDLTVDTPKADFVVGENVEIVGTAIIVNVKESTFHNKGTLNAVDIQDTDGTSFENHSQGAIKGDVSINTIGEVKLIGKVDSVEVNQAAKITVDAAATIAKLNVKVENVVLNAPKGSVGKVEAAAGVIVKDNTGAQVITQPAVQPAPVYNPPVILTSLQLISKYEELQKSFISKNLDNEELYWEYNDLIVAREKLAKELAERTLTIVEKELVDQIDNALDIYLVESYEPFGKTSNEIDEYRVLDGFIDLYKQDGTGVSIEWVSSHPEIITNEGVVTKPARGEEPVKVTLTAKMTRNEANREVDFTITITPEENIYTKAKSLTIEYWKSVSEIEGYFSNRVNVTFDVKEIKKEYPEAVSANVYIFNGFGEENSKAVENVSIENTVTFNNPFKFSMFSTMNSGNVRIELLNAENDVITEFHHQIRVYNMYSFAELALENERATLDVDNIVKYIPDGSEYTKEQKEIIIEQFKNVKIDFGILEELQKLALAVKQERAE